MTVSEALTPGEEIRYRARPAARSFWVFFLGILLLGVAPFLRDNPPISPATGLLFAGIFALLIARRWTEVYTVTNRRILVRAGLFGRESSEVPLSDVVGVESFTGFNLRLVGAAHILVPVPIGRPGKHHDVRPAQFQGASGKPGTPGGGSGRPARMGG